MPTKAACPSESWPAQPPTRSQAVARAAKSTRLKPKFMAPPKRSGQRASARRTSPIRRGAGTAGALGTAAPEEAGGADQQHQEEGDEPEGVAIAGGPEGRPERLHQAEEEPAPDGPGDVPHPPEHGHHEGLEGEDAPH